MSSLLSLSPLAKVGGNSQSNFMLFWIGHGLRNKIMNILVQSHTCCEAAAANWAAPDAKELQP